MRICLPSLHRHAQWILPIALLLSFSSAKAGLIIEISDKIDISSIKSMKIQGDNLILHYGVAGKRVIQLPVGGMDNLLLWVSQPCSGPFVISVDGALVSNSPTYTSPCFPPGLASAMINYDVYAHSFTQGEIPEKARLHPLIRKTSNTSMMPHNQFISLLSASNQSPNALWYRNLTSRFPESPGVIGEFTIKAVPSKHDFPLKIEVVSHRWFRPSLWYREVTAPSEFDNTTFDLPYAPLKKDIENRFKAYRKSFKPFDELASFIEGYAILKNTLEKKPAVWNALLNEKCAYDIENCIQAGFIDHENGPEISYDDEWNPEISWPEWSTREIGKTVETSQEADLALCHLWDNSYELKNNDLAELWEIGIEKIARQHPDIKAKYLLYLFRNETSSERRMELADQFLNLTRNNKDLMRLRIVGCNKMQSLDEGEWLKVMIENERKQITQDFITAVNDLKKQQPESNDDFLGWEDLSQTVFSTGLLEFLGESLNGHHNQKFFDPKLAQSLAYLMYRRGQSFYLGEGLAYEHSDLRYLGYLSKALDPVNDTILIQKIYDYRSELANKINLIGWDETEFNKPLKKMEQDYSIDGIEMSSLIVNVEPWRNYPLVEGIIMSSETLFSKDIKSNSLPLNGKPVGIYSSNGSFILLLLDSRIFPENRIKAKTRLRAYGITYPNIKAMTPIRIEIREMSGQWVPLDIPHSGTSIRGLLDGH